MKNQTFLNRIFTMVLLVLTFNVLGQSGAVAYYPFSGNSNDESGNGHHGIIHGNPQLVEDRNGVPNSAYKFDGIDDYIQVPYHSDLQPTTAVTLSLWAHRSTWVGIDFYAGLAGNTESGGYELYVFYDYYYDYAELWTYVRRNGYYANLKEQLEQLSPGWHHFALTHESQNYSTSLTRLYVNGIQVDSDIEYGNYPVEYAHQNSFLIGAEAGPGDEPEGDYWDGAIDEVLVYDRELNAEEIMALFTGPGEEIDISLTAGWNAVSSYLVPNDPNIEMIFQPIADDFIIAWNYSGVYCPAQSINTLQTWNSQDAFLIKTSEICTLSIQGEMESNNTVVLNEGWNLLPVVSEDPVNIENLLAPVSDKVQIVKDGAGPGIFWPDYNINTIGNLMPGSAYYIRVTETVEVSF